MNKPDGRLGLTALGFTALASCTPNVTETTPKAHADLDKDGVAKIEVKAAPKGSEEERIEGVRDYLKYMTDGICKSPATIVFDVNQLAAKASCPPKDGVFPKGYKSEAQKNKPKVQKPKVKSEKKRRKGRRRSRRRSRRR